MKLLASSETQLLTQRRSAKVSLMRPTAKTASAAVPSLYISDPDVLAARIGAYKKRRRSRRPVVSTTIAARGDEPCYADFFTPAPLFQPATARVA